MGSGFVGYQKTRAFSLKMTEALQGFRESSALSCLAYLRVMHGVGEVTGWY